ncbi:MAG: DUF3276 family protein [Treponema sp.]|jgi:hypothetical protein|nr:DUF3276 family protein [Treponema sp.]
MGIRGEIYSTTVGLPNRTYFFNVKENRLGDLYLNIVESKNKDSGGFERQSVILFADDLSEFLKGFDESLRALEKAMKEKRRGALRESRPREGFGDRRPREGFGDRRPREGFGDRRPGRAAAEGEAGNRRRSGDAKPGASGRSRVVVTRKRKGPPQG